MSTSWYNTGNIWIARRDLRACKDHNSKRTTTEDEQYVHIKRGEPIVLLGYHMTIAQTEHIRFLYKQQVCYLGEIDAALDFLINPREFSKLQKK